MRRLEGWSCRVYDALIGLYPEQLQQRYGDEMRLVFRDLMDDASQRGLPAIMKVWGSVAAEMAGLLAPVYARRVGLLAASVAASSMLIGAMAMGFCTMGPVVVVHGYSQTAIDAVPGRKDRTVTTPEGQHMFLSCWEPRELPEVNTVILVSGRGIGDHSGWAPVQEAVSKFARVCSYDPIGTGKSDAQPVAADVDGLAGQMHALFIAARLPQPYILVGTSLGGVLARRYETRFPSDVGGFVFADSSHEEMNWRDAAIAEKFDPAWNDPHNLHDNGLLAKGQLSTWHDDVPMVVLERSERAPCEAFPGLSPKQCDGINDAWHSFQVDLSHRSKYGELRIVEGAGHLMVMTKPDAVAKAVQDVIAKMPR